jgi:aminocarboxymuconate-semialdehyde decarboxylase
MDEICANSNGRLLGLGTLPIRNLDACMKQVEQIAQSPNLKGFILGTHGLGKGLDDERLLPLYQSCAEKKLLLFIHPHYGKSAINILSPCN